MADSKEIKNLKAREANTQKKADRGKGYEFVRKTKQYIATHVKGNKSDTVAMTRNGPKASESDHLQPQQFSMPSGTYVGKHIAPNSATSMRAARKNAYGSSYRGQHRNAKNQGRENVQIMRDAA